MLGLENGVQNIAPNSQRMFFYHFLPQQTIQWVHMPCKQGRRHPVEEATTIRKEVYSSRGQLDIHYTVQNVLAA